MPGPVRDESQEGAAGAQGAFQGRVDQIAQEAGARVVATLYNDALGDPPVTSYEEVIRWDTNQLVTALR